MKQERRDGVGHSCALDAQNFVAVDPHAFYLQDVGEIGRVTNSNLEEHERRARRSFSSPPGERTHLQLAMTNRVRSIPANHPG
jgi:hypothetical protein